MNNEKLAWLAGLWDGEGSITAFRHKEKGGNIKIKPCLVLTNTNVELINEAVKILDTLDIRMHVIDYTRPKSKRIYQLTTSKLSNLKKFCHVLTPYLIGKKAQAELLARYVDARLSRIESGNGWNQNTKYSDEELSMQEALQALNHRGESSETIRLTPKGDDIVRTNEKSLEVDSKSLR